MVGEISSRGKEENWCISNDVRHGGCSIVLTSNIQVQGEGGDTLQIVHSQVGSQTIWEVCWELLGLQTAPAAVGIVVTEGVGDD